MVTTLMENDATYITAKVATSATGMAMTGITAARHVCRKMKTMRTTRSTASRSVSTTAEIDALTNGVVL